MDGLENLRIIQEKLGIDLFLVGGAVRDLILNKTLQDLDFTTPETPDTVEKAILEAGYKPFLIGKKFGTVGFNLDSKILVEITTFRSERYLDKNRKPEVEFVTDLNEDLSRRDFTINSMAMNSSGELFDFYGGVEDLEKGIIRSVGAAKKRFREDPLRMLRAIRFSGTLGFEIEEKTWLAIQLQYLELLNISKERITAEMDKILSLPRVFEVLQTLKDSRLLNVILPEITTQFNYNQKSHYHDFDLFAHTSKVVGNVPAENLNLRWAALLHDIAKPYTQTFDGKKSVNHFLGHNLLGVDLADSICRRLKFSNQRREYIIEVIQNHLQPNSELKMYDDLGKKLPEGFLKKQVVIITGGDSFNSYNEYLNYLTSQELRLNSFTSWASNLAQDLGAEFEIFKPSMPNTNNAKYAEWRIQFEKLLPLLRESPILVGWSLGGIFLAKYLAENVLQVQALHLVAAPFKKVGDFELPNELSLLTKNSNEIFIYHSKDDFVVDFLEAKMYQQNLLKSNLEFVEFENRNHFLQSEFKELAHNIKSLEKNQ